MNRTKDDEAKYEDNNNNNTYTAGAHVGETAASQDSSTTSDVLSIGANVSDVTKHIVQPTRYMQDISAAHPVNDPIRDHPNACDVSIDTGDRVEAITGSHIVEPEYIFRRPFHIFEDIELFDNAPSDIIDKDGLYQFMDNYDKWDDSLNTTGVNNYMGISHTITTINTSGSANKSIKSDFGIGERQS